VYWTFGFLRMGTTGLTAQARGAADEPELRAALGRALLIALLGGGLLIALQWPLRFISFALLDGTAEVEALARSYFDIRIWSAPAALANYALLGWFIGLERARTALLLQVFLNGLNIALDFWFVAGLGWGVAGIAAGTLLAELSAALLGVIVALRYLRKSRKSEGGQWDWRRIMARAPLLRTIAINRDIFIRTVALLAAFAWFTAQSAKAGNVVLAANAILLQFVSVSAYFLDGFAFAAEVFVGKAIGARDPRALLAAVRLSGIWAAAMAILISLAYLLSGAVIIDLLTIDPDVRGMGREFLGWAVAMPIVSVWCFLLDGIFIGATRGPEMRNASLASTGIFLLLWWALLPLGIDGLWLAFLLFNVARAVTLGAYFPRLVRGLQV
ncbi:MAG TPA: MATE family efflux transporter, partial [Alphaproteobacteria bacterium]|nr:MATE family efflux transporter [Alphaproteobacteria bacterium]